MQLEFVFSQVLVFQKFMLVVLKLWTAEHSVLICLMCDMEFCVHLFHKVIYPGVSKEQSLIIMQRGTHDNCDIFQPRRL